MGYPHIDSCKLRLEEGKQHMFLAIDRVTKFTRVAFFDVPTKQNGAAFLEEVVAVYPYNRPHRQRYRLHRTGKIQEWPNQPFCWALL